MDDNEGRISQGRDMGDGVPSFRQAQPGTKEGGRDMSGRYPKLSDMPAVCCGRCAWYHQVDADGNGRCLLDGCKRYYKCMVCVEYEFGLKG